MRRRVPRVLVVLLTCVATVGGDLSAAGVAPAGPTGGTRGAAKTNELPQTGRETTDRDRLVGAVKDRQPSGRQSMPRRRAADLVFSGTTTLDGAIEIEGRGGELAIRKRVMQDGSFTLDMEASKDKVTVGFSSRAITIRRDRKAITLPIGDPREDDLDKARRLLADSRAVRLFRTAAAAAVDAEDDGLSAVALVASDALVGFLSGDVGAPGRVARHLARRGRVKTRPAGLQQDCYREWEQRVMVASYDWESCVNDFSVWNPIRNLCALRWLIAIETYWFSLIGCAGIGSII